MGGNHKPGEAIKFHDAARQDTNDASVLDRIATEHNISELRGQQVEQEAREPLRAIGRRVHEIHKAVEDQVEAEEEQEFCAWDDVKGSWLNVKDVQAARKEEVGYMKERGIWVERSIEGCWQKTGKALTHTHGQKSEK